LTLHTNNSNLSNIKTLNLYNSKISNIKIVKNGILEFEEEFLDLRDFTDLNNFDIRNNTEVKYI